MTRPARWLAFAAVAVAALLTLGIVTAWLGLRLSLPTLDGRLDAAGLQAPVTVHRDAQGVATILAATRHDLFYAQGFVHAQERFFQMDLARRVAAGRLAQLFGARALDADRSARVHGLTHVAAEVLASVTPARRAQLDAYARGVNAGLAALRVRPFEYLVLNVAPEPWRSSDTVMVSFAMFLDLTDETAQLDRVRGLLYDSLPPAVYAWLTAPGNALDAPIGGPPVTLPSVPPARWFTALPAGSGAPPPAPPAGYGSNSFAVAGTLTQDGSALLANDMHLGLRLPNTWFRVRLVEGPPAAPAMQAVGVSLPGVPGIIVGSNTHIAWGFTNSYGDWSDRVVLRIDEGTPGRYRVPRGGDTLTVREELIHVKGAPPVTISVPMTRFGPIVAADYLGRPVAVRWLAHRPAATNFDLLDMLDVTEVDSALALANRTGLPPQNILVAGRDGRIGWTVAGRLPRRVGYDPTVPVMSDDEGGWQGWLAPASYPRVTDPPFDRLWTANARVASLEQAPLIGTGGYPLGARAGQIRDGLFARERFTEADMLALATDNAGRFLQRWRGVMRAVLTTEATRGRPDRERLLGVLSQGRLYADVDSVAYRLVREFRERIERDLMAAFVAPVRQAPLDFRLLLQREGPLWQAVSERPQHLIPDGFPSWDAYLLHVADAVIAPYGDDLGAATWGQRNRAQIEHPLAGALPGWLGRHLRMPREALPGDAWMPRVQGPSFGASQRLVVAPGHEERGLFHMPGGQSGHPLSPYYGAGHADWAQARPSPLLPGPTRYTLIFSPAQSTE